MGSASGGTVAVCRLLAAALAVLVLAPAQAAASPTDWLDLRALNIAHQGGEDEAPSNTMYSYERALRLGADMLEVDIHTSADGKLVVLHDATVDRTTNGSGRVYDMTLEQIQALDAGYNLVPGEGTEAGRPASEYPYRGVRTGEREPPPGFRARDFRIPTLGEVMRAYPKVPINIEIKGAADTDVASFLANAEALAAFLNRLGRTRGIIVASFNDLAIQRFHQLAPEVDLAPAIAGVAAYKLAGVPPPAGTVAFQVPIDFEGITVVDEPFVDMAHEDGYAVHVWTINDEQTMRQLLDWDADAIMTAEPIRLERVLCDRGADRPRRPAGARGGHCSKRASIACEVEPISADAAGGTLRVGLRRRDGFAGRCAGQLGVRFPGTRAPALAAFNFGMRPPADGGPATRVVGVPLPAATKHATVRLRTHPYSAFAEHSTLPVR